MFFTLFGYRIHRDTTRPFYLMKQKSITLTLLALLSLFAVACSQNTSESDNETEITSKTNERYQNSKDTAPEIVEHSTTTAKANWSEFSDYTIEKKEAAVEFLEDQNRQIQKQIEALKESAEGKSGTAKEKIERSLTTLESKSQKLAIQFEKTKRATEDTWNSLRSETQEMWNDFHDNLNEVKRSLNTKQ